MKIQGIKKVKQLFTILPKQSGRDVQGHVAVRHQGGREKRMYRTIDWMRTKDGIPATVIAIEYDPNRSADVALVQYKDGEKRYILAPVDLQVGAKVISGEHVDITIGNTMPLRAIPVGTLVHNIEIKPGHGAQMIRSAGTFAMVLAKDGKQCKLNFLPEKCVCLPQARVQQWDN